MVLSAVRITPRRVFRLPTLSTTLVGALLVAACTGDTKKIVPPVQDPPFDPTPTVVDPSTQAPTLSIEILEVAGASGVGGVFLPGDSLTVRFRMRKADGSGWHVSELVEAEALVSGPTSGYQRVVPVQADVADVAVEEQDLVFRYTFPPLPAVYLAPYNDTPRFGVQEGERTGEPLADGTYTLGFSFTWRYTVEGKPFLRVGEITHDFLVGAGAALLEPREVSLTSSCNRCHTNLAGHDGRYRDLTLCLLCHTAGAEDLDDAALGGGTPGVTIDARVLFHRIHSGRHLPSVNGVSTAPGGLRDYNAAPVPFLVAGPRGLRDFSGVGWPVMPNSYSPMPRDIGHAALTATKQAKDDLIRSGAANCDVCHADPDGAGPLPAPAQGERIYTRLSRSACGSCHDDVDFGRPYIANELLMSPQPDDVLCVVCHVDGSGISTREEHRHPLQDPRFFAGLDVELLAVAESGVNDADGTFDVGEGIEVTARFTDGLGAEVDPNEFETIRVLLTGPTSNHQLVLDTEIGTDRLVGPQPFVFRLTELVAWEQLGSATAGLGDTFQTQRTPVIRERGFHLLVRDATSGKTVSVALARAGQSYVDVADASTYLRGHFVAVDDGVPGLVEYQRVALVDGNRLWFRDELRLDHAGGAPIAIAGVQEKTEGVHFSLDDATGVVTELIEFGAWRPVLLSYTTEFALPERYPPRPLSSGELTDATGKWTGLDLVDGTYTLGLSIAREVEYVVQGQERTTYLGSSPLATSAILVGSAASKEPYARMLGNGCDECHVDLSYHDGRHVGFESCVTCHAGGGVEDLSRRVAGNAPETPGRRVDFLSLLHRIHRGSSAADASYSVVGAGPGDYPDNFVLRTWAQVRYPTRPGGERNCGTCHVDAATLLPSDRAHPTQQVRQLDSWAAACGACHDSPPDLAHMAAQTAPNGAESCSICHAAGEDADTVAAHAVRY